MGTWDTGPFDNDTAADFANALDDAEPEAREALIRGLLVRTIDATGCLTEAEEAVAAALIAAQCPGGESVDPPYGPEAPVPVFPSGPGHSLTKPSLASPTTRLGRHRTGSPRRTGSSGGPYSPAFAQCLPRRRLQRSLRRPVMTERHSARKLSQNPRSHHNRLRPTDLSDRRWFQFPQGTDPIWQSYWNGGSPREGPVVRAVQECLQAVLWNGTVGLAPFGHDLPAELAVVPLIGMASSRVVAVWNEGDTNPLIRSFVETATAAYRR
jgi:hypothetical protein